jgi:hypothetical protein
LRPAVAERVRGTTQMLGMVMTVNAIEHLDRHAEKTKEAGGSSDR